MSAGTIKTDASGKRWMWDPTKGEGGDWVPEVWDPRLGEGGGWTFTPTPAPVEPPPPDPYATWLSKPTGERSWRYIADDATRKFYEDNPTQAWQQYNTDQFGDRNTPMADYAKNQYGRYYADYLRWSEGDATGQRTWTDYQTTDLAGKIRDSFTMQSPNQKGYNLLFSPSGRVT